MQDVKPNEIEIIREGTALQIVANLGVIEGKIKKTKRTYQSVRDEADPQSFIDVAQAFESVSLPFTSIENVYRVVWDEMIEVDGTLTDEARAAHNAMYYEAARHNAVQRNVRDLNRKKAQEKLDAYMADHPDAFPKLKCRLTNKVAVSDATDDEESRFIVDNDIVETCTISFVFIRSDGSSWTLKWYNGDKNVTRETAGAAGLKILNADLFMPGGMDLVELKEVKVEEKEVTKYEFIDNDTLEELERFKASLL